MIRNAFSPLHYPGEVFAQCVRRLLTYSLSLRNIEEMMADRGIVVDHSTLNRWVIRLARYWIRRLDCRKAHWGVGDEWMKPTLKSEENGNIYTMRSTRQDK